MIRNKKNIVTIYNSVNSLNEAAAKLLQDIANKSIEERGRFALALSGGNTPNKLYTLLSTQPYCASMPWKNTFVFWGDERCVPPDDERNNAATATNLLLHKIDIPPSNIFPVPVQLPPALAAKKYEEMLRNFFAGNTPRFDLILLGLGENGHTASLFPETTTHDSNRAAEQSTWVREVYVEEQRMHRITMTAPLINKARQILFLVTGEEKCGILETVLTGAYLPGKYPAQLINPEHGEARWFVDQKAAGGNKFNN